MSELLLYPEYAIGQQLITRAEYDDIRNSYYVQGQAACGLFIPLIGLSIASVGSDQVSVPWYVKVLVPLFAVLALVGGLDRLHKYQSELQALIVGRFERKKQEARDAKKPPVPAEPTLLAELAKLQKAFEELQREIKSLPQSPVTVNNFPGMPPR